jgi:hypothetical protein
MIDAFAAMRYNQFPGKILENKFLPWQYSDKQIIQADISIVNG